MINKCDYMYAVFNENVVCGATRLFNAIEPFTVEDKCDVASTNDIINWFCTNGRGFHNIPKGVIWTFRTSGSLSNVTYYISRTFLATGKGNSKNPVIRAFWKKSILVITSMTIYNTFNSLFSDITCINRVYSLGNLSTPHSVVCNHGANSTNSYNLTRIKLPLYS